MPKGKKVVKTARKAREPGRYPQIIERIFQTRYEAGATEVNFQRTDIEDAARELDIELPKNQGDVLYNIRFRASMPESVTLVAEPGKEWVIELRGRAKYAFRQVPISRIRPNPQYESIKIPDATPEIIRQYAKSDEQALLAITRYNRLIDIFLGMATYSLQNHLRTTTSGRGQIEIDELYVGVDKDGRHYAIPVQAKGGKDQIGVVQIMQDIDYCTEAYPDLTCLPISVQFMEGDKIAIFLLKVENDEIRIREEKHYLLVPASDIDPRDWKPFA